MLAADRRTARAGLAPATALFRSLADPAMLAILQRLAGGSARVVDLTAELGLAQPTDSQHLACLRDCGLVQSRPVGRASVYSLAQRALADLLPVAEAVLAATGNTVALCPAYGSPRDLPVGAAPRLRRRGFALEYASMAWMVAEAAVAIAAEMLASSIALTGFGLNTTLGWW
jgi:DNA-binding transcriptional ArsR family regulator